MKTHKDLDVWKKSVDFVVDIYQLSGKFPKEERYGLVNQMRRASVSIPSNIAEGAARNHSKEFARFLYIALSSGAEIETQIIIATRLGYLNQQNSEILLNKLTSIQKMIQGLIRSISS